MIHENIRAARHQSGLSQEEVAVKCHVVRQTVAKWENGRSLPDAATLVTLAEALNVSVMQLLGTTDVAVDAAVSLRQELETLQARQALLDKANRVRGVILLLCLAALLVAIRAGESVGAMVAVGVCLVASLVTLWRNMEALTFVSTPDANLHPIRIVTVVSVMVIAGATGLAVLMERGLVSLPEEGAKALLVALLAGLMAFFGWIGPKLPFNRHTGFRLPWTVADADTWNLAHRTMGWMGLPMALLYAAAAYIFADFGVVTAVALVIYLGVPGTVSGIYYWKKMTGRL